MIVLDRQYKGKRTITRNKCSNKMKNKISLINKTEVFEYVHLKVIKQNKIKYCFFLSVHCTAD